jgi:hypothetical protein
MLYDAVGSRVAMRAFTQDFLNLKASEDGFVHLDFAVHDLSENAQPIHMLLRVTKDAVRRESNLSFFSQRQYCGDACDSRWIFEARQAFAAARGLRDE